MRIYDDIWTANIAGVPCANLSQNLKHHLDHLYPEGWEANTHLLLMTLGAPYIGQWHVDAPPYEDDTIVLICLAGVDEIEYPGKQKHMYPGDSLLLPAGTRHRGRCSTFRVTYHCRVGPKGKVMPESPMDLLPPMTFTRFLKRTYRTLRYWLS